MVFEILLYSILRSESWLVSNVAPDGSLPKRRARRKSLRPSSSLLFLREQILFYGWCSRMMYWLVDSWMPSSFHCSLRTNPLLRYQCGRMIDINYNHWYCYEKIKWTKLVDMVDTNLEKSRTNLTLYKIGKRVFHLYLVNNIYIFTY